MLLGPRHHIEAEQRAEFQLFLRQRGIRSNNVLRALETVPRSLFVPEELQPHAYSDRALPIACGQTISQPFLVAYMTEQLELNDSHKVLEVGMGSGYQTAVLARIARRVYTIDRYRTLVTAAEARLQALRITNVTAMPGDGTQGWPAQAPFDRIIVTAAADQVPKALYDQLGRGRDHAHPGRHSPGGAAAVQDREGPGRSDRREAVDGSEICASGGGPRGVFVTQFVAIPAATSCFHVRSG